MPRFTALALILGSAACAGPTPPPVHVPVADVTAPTIVATAPAAPAHKTEGLAARPIAPSSSLEWDAGMRAYEVYKNGASSQRAHDEAQYRIGTALDRAGLFVAAFGIYSEIADRRQGPFRGDVLVRFGEVAEDPIARGIDIVERVGRFAVAELDAPKVATTRGELAHLMGLYFYRNHQWDVAVKLLATVPKTSPAFARAQVLAGLCHVQMHEGKGAIESFRAASGATDENVKSLASLSLARTLYAGGFQRAPGGGFNVKYAPRAIPFYEQVKAEPYASEAAFELAWAKHYGGDDAGALQTLARLTKASAPTSSALLFEAYLHWRACRYEDATASLDNLEKTYKPLEPAARELASKLPGDDHEHDWYEIAHQGGGPAALAPWMPALLARPEIALTVGLVEETKRETAGVKANAPPSWKISELGNDVFDALQLTLDIGERNVAEILRRELAALTEQVGADLRRVRPLRDAVAAGKRGGPVADQACAKK